MDTAALARILARLLETQRWGVLATRGPWAAHVAFAPWRGGLLLHLSTLAAHTRHLLADPAAALAVGEADDGRTDPQTLARATLRGRVAPVEAAARAAAGQAYLARFPAAAPRFAFTDFALYRLEAEEARVVAGLGAAGSLRGEVLRRALAP
ncbi:pyridoxamine 5'-phosphate oxidase family protein [Inmirania thermothiophila]|uniref:CREG-like beta-barrel domain-containing protein n=1 Tax=Inmirania thermothiophila TaxID=1750597 RepID=A0A3N1Y5X0_9GAMM|nr:pyridoxamine 5'-phosphate oxidase family protein [Inmirania thermothiophila]ROR34150.1 hypothetical protein EDC57_0045 [Inmirania thermothiophila]